MSPVGCTVLKVASEYCSKTVWFKEDTVEIGGDESHPARSLISIIQNETQSSIIISKKHLGRHYPLMYYMKNNIYSRRILIEDKDGPECKMLQLWFLALPISSKCIRAFHWWFLLIVVIVCTDTLQLHIAICTLPIWLVTLCPWPMLIWKFKKIFPGKLNLGHL